MYNKNYVKFLKKTGKRAMSGLFTISKNKTTIDPTGILMMKQHSRIQNVNKDDYENMCDKLEMSTNEAIAHIECISSIPFSSLKYDSEVVENVMHPMPTLPEENETKINVFVLPSGTGKTTMSNKFKQLRSKDDKRIIDIDDIILYDGRERLMAESLSKNDFSILNAMNRERLMNALDSKRYSTDDIFLIHDESMFDDKSKMTNLPLKILGKFKVTEREMRQSLRERDEIHKQATINNWRSSTAEIKSRSDIMKKINQASKRREILSERSQMPEIKLYPNNWNLSWERVLAGENVPPTYWTKDVREYTSPRAINYPRINDKEKYVMAPYSELTTYNEVLSDFLKFLDNNKDADEVHLWTQGNLNGNYDPLRMANKLFSDVKMKQQIAEFSVSSDLVKEYWSRDLKDTDDHYLKCATLSNPRRINVVGWRVCNFGIRDYKQTYPQLVPSTTIGKIMKINRGNLIGVNTAEIYLNYSGHVRLRKIMTNEIEDLDFAYELLENGTFMAVIPKEGCFVVDNVSMFSGYGSLCTSLHSAYGLGRDVKSLMNEYKRKMITDVGSSGHMIASSLMFRCHLLTYLQEILINNTSKKSIYNLPVVEPTSGLYHTKQEYQHAVSDIRNLIRQGVMNKIVQSNLHVIALFVEKLM